MSQKKFLAIGDLLINPDLLAYATVEDDVDGPRLRMGFATASSTSSRTEVRLSGEDAGIAIRWLRLNATPLTQAGSFCPIGRPIGRASAGPSTEGITVNSVAHAIA